MFKVYFNRGQAAPARGQCVSRSNFGSRNDAVDAAVLLVSEGASVWLVVGPDGTEISKAEIEGLARLQSRHVHARGRRGRRFP